MKSVFTIYVLLYREGLLHYLTLPSKHYVWDTTFVSLLRYMHYTAYYILCRSRSQCIIRVLHAIRRLPSIIIPRRHHQDVGGGHWVSYYVYQPHPLWVTYCRFCTKTYQGHREWVRSVKVSPDGALLASCSNDQVMSCDPITMRSCDPLYYRQLEYGWRPLRNVKLS